jgi:hypothetical protein
MPVYLISYETAYLSLRGEAEASLAGLAERGLGFGLVDRPQDFDYGAAEVAAQNFL